MCYSRDTAEADLARMVKHMETSIKEARCLLAKSDSTSKKSITINYVVRDFDQGTPFEQKWVPGPTVTIDV